MIKQANNNSAGNTPFSKRFRIKMKQNRKIFIVTLLLQLLGIPVAALCQIIVNYRVEYMIRHTALVDMKAETRALAAYEYLYGLALVMLAAAVLSGIYTALKTFGYLHKRSDADITLSLPLSGKQLFSADYLSGLLTYIIPFITVVFLTMPVWLLKSDSKSSMFNMTGPADLINFDIKSYTIPAFGFVLKLEVFILLTMIFIYTFTVLIALCCGTLRDTITFLILSNASAGLFLFSFRILNESCIVNDDGYRLNSTYEFERLTPAGAVHFIYRYMSNENEDYHVDSGDLNWAVWCAVMCILCFIAAYFVFRRRKAEDTGKTVIVPALFITTAFLSVVAVIFTAIRIYDISRNVYSVEAAVLILIAIILSLAAYCFLLSIKERSIKFILSPKEMILPACSAAAAVAVFLVMANTNAFGQLYSIPDADDIDKIYIHLPTKEMCESPHEAGTGVTNCYTDTVSIKKICDLHAMLNEDLRLSIEDGSALDNYNANFPDLTAFRSELDTPTQTICLGDDTIAITYCMKNGKVYSKSFIPLVTDYSKSEIFQYEADKLVSEMEHTHQVEVNSLNKEKFRVCFGSTDFTEKLYGHRFHSYVASNDPYPREYVATEFDRDLLKEILYASYYPVYYSTEDCYVFYIDIYNEKAGEYYQGNLKFFLPAEYSDLYEKFTETSNARKVKWYTTDENGNEISVNT